MNILHNYFQAIDTPPVTSASTATKRGIDGKKRKKPVQITIFTVFDDNGQPIGILVRNGYLINHVLTNLVRKDQNVGGIEIRKLSHPAVVTFIKEIADKPLPASSPVFKAWGILDGSDALVNDTERWQNWSALARALGRVLENAQGNGKGSVFDYYIFSVTYQNHDLTSDEADRLLTGVLDSEAFIARMRGIEVVELEEEEEDLRAAVIF